MEVRWMMMHYQQWGLAGKPHYFLSSKHRLSAGHYPTGFFINFITDQLKGRPVSRSNAKVHLLQCPTLGPNFKSPSC
jgi:hypothetical protein